jgi:hypothetical protein
LSQIYLQKNSVPQKSTLSIKLIFIAINRITEATKFLVKSSLFADDLNIFYRWGNLLGTQKSLQETINTLLNSTHKTGFTLSAEKSQNKSITRKKPPYRY